MGTGRHLGGDHHRRRALQVHGNRDVLGRLHPRSAVGRGGPSHASMHYKCMETERYLEGDHHRCPCTASVWEQKGTQRLHPRSDGLVCEREGGSPSRFCGRRGEVWILRASSGCCDQGDRPGPISPPWRRGLLIAPPPACWDPLRGHTPGFGSTPQLRIPWRDPGQSPSP